MMSRARNSSLCSATKPCEICLGAGYKVPVPKKSKKSKKALEEVPEETPEDARAAITLIIDAIRKCPAEQKAELLQGLRRLFPRPLSPVDSENSPRPGFLVDRGPSPDRGEEEETATETENAENAEDSEDSEEEEEETEDSEESEEETETPENDREKIANMLSSTCDAPTASSAAATASAPQSSALLPDGPFEEGDKGYDTDGLCAVAPGESHATLDAELDVYHAQGGRPAPPAPVPALPTDPSTIRNQWHYSLPGSSVVSTKAGLLLELRRGDITWVRFKEDRRTWSSFAEWRAAVGDHVNPIVF